MTSVLDKNYLPTYNVWYAGAGVSNKVLVYSSSVKDKVGKDYDFHYIDDESYYIDIIDDDDE